MAGIKKKLKYLLRGNLKLLVLNIILRNPIHGYGLTKELEKLYNWRPSCGTLYPVLSDLEDKGFVESSETVECGRFKKIYSITKKGRVKLKELINEFQGSLQILKLNEKF